MTAVGILGLGTYLPPEVRTNDWWPADVVAGWAARQAAGLAALRTAPLPSSPGARRVTQAMLDLRGDPFEGARRRHVLAADATATDAEALAARAALAHADVAPDAIDLLLVHTAIPEYIGGNTACALHQRLGLGPSCLALEAHAAAYAFLAQLAIAAPMIAAGTVRHALLVQSSAAVRAIDPLDAVGARIGDAATAVVLGPVAPGFGLLGASHTTDSRAPWTIVAGVRGGRWFDGASTIHVADPAGARQVFLDSVDDAAAAIDGALTAAGLAPRAIDHLAAHHAAPWMTGLVQEQAGLAHARTTELFAETAYVFATSVPLVLHRALVDGALAPGDRVIMLAGGAGMVRGATALRWGRGR